MSLFTRKPSGGMFRTGVARERPDNSLVTRDSPWPIAVQSLLGSSCVGMVRPLTVRCGSPYSTSHVRDGPPFLHERILYSRTRDVSCGTVKTAESMPPRTRGCSGYHGPVSDPPSSASPRARMLRTPRWTRWSGRRVSLACEDAPSMVRRSGGTVFPRARGCFRDHDRGARPHQGVSPRAGMIRSRRAAPGAGTGCLPPPRGDAPSSGCTPAWHSACLPRARGCSAAGLLRRLLRVRGWSAYADDDRRRVRVSPLRAGCSGQALRGHGCPIWCLPLRDALT